MTVDGDSARGSVELPIVFEGPPDIVHGGFLAVFFDCVIQHHNCELGVAGKTTDLRREARGKRPRRAGNHKTGIGHHRQDAEQ